MVHEPEINRNLVIKVVVDGYGVIDVVTRKLHDVFAAPYLGFGRQKRRFRKRAVRAGLNSCLVIVPIAVRRVARRFDFSIDALHVGRIFYVIDGTVLRIIAYLGDVGHRLPVARDLLIGHHYALRAVESSGIEITGLFALRRGGGVVPIAFGVLIHAEKNGLRLRFRDVRFRLRKICKPSRRGKHDRRRTEESDESRAPFSGISD